MADLATLVNALLDHRELGFALGVMIGLFFLFRKGIDEWIKRDDYRKRVKDEKEQELIKIEQKRKDDDARFLRDMVSQSRVDGQARAIEIQKLIESFTESNSEQTRAIGQMCDAMKGLKKTVDDHEYHSRDRYRELLSAKT